MKKPTARNDSTSRGSDNVKRASHPAPDQALVEHLSRSARYVGYAKHKAATTDFGLALENTLRGDATLCDRHAGFTPQKMTTIPHLLRRRIRARLIEEPPRIIRRAAVAQLAPRPLARPVVFRRS